MRIGIIGYELEGHPTGVGRYLEGLLEGVAAQGTEEAPNEDHLVLFFKGDRFEHSLWSRRRGTGPRFEPRFDQRADRSPILWEQLRLPKVLRQAELDVLFSPGYSLPEGLEVPSVVTLHDLSFEHLGEEFAFKERWRRRLLARRAASTAHRVLADTHTIADDLVNTYGLPADKVEVVPLGLADPFRTLAAAPPAPPETERLAEIGVEGSYVLALGTLLPRRRLDLAIEAFAGVAARHPETRLVIAGANRLPDPTVLDRWIAGSGVAERIQCLDWVPEASLTALMQSAEAVVYLSAYEGFGLPPLEAMAVGTPAVTSPGLALDDLRPEAPFRVARLEAEAVRHALATILADPAAARQAIEPLRPTLAALDWAGPSQRWREILAQVVAETASSRRSRK